MNLQEAQLATGHGVTYQPHPAAPREYGTITAVSQLFVFVLFEGETRAKACRAEDLVLA